MQNLLHGSTRGEKFLCIKMELKQTAVALWYQMDGRILPLFHDCVKDLHSFRTEITTNQPNSFWKQVFFEEGYATSLGWGDILPDSDSPQWHECCQFLSYSIEETCSLDTAYAFNSIPEILPFSSTYSKDAVTHGQTAFSLQTYLTGKMAGGIEGRTTQ